jgi:hypothetical protein
MEDDLSLDEMAQSVRLGTAHFARMFRESTGETPHQFVLRQRVERAKAMLRATDARVLDVAVACYLGVPFAKLTHREWSYPRFNTKYNALQRAAYFSVLLAGFLSVATGWAIHKPMQLHWLAALFGGFDAARVWHFWLSYGSSFSLLCRM